MPSPVFKQYEQLLQAMINVVVSRTGLNDVTDSSVFKHLLAASARELDEAYYQLGLIPDLFSIDTAVGEDLDARAAEIQPATLSRNQAAKAAGQVVFSRSGTAGTISIPAGTVVKTSAGVMFQTTAAGTIPNLSTSSGQVPVVAQEGGAAGNVAAGSVVRFDSKPLGVDTVTNPSSMVGGLDQESDDAFRARLKRFVSTLARCTPEALEYIALTASLPSGERVRFAHVFEDPYNRGEVTLYIDDGTGTAESAATATGENLCEGLAGPPADSCVGGEQYLWTNHKPIKSTPAPAFTSSVSGPLTEGTDYLLDRSSGQLFFPTARVTGEVITATSYTYNTGLVAEVQKIVDGDPFDRETYPGWRAAGVRVLTTVPTVRQIAVTASVVVAEGYTKGWVSPGVYAAGSVLEGVANAIISYVNGLGISGDVILAELITACMEVPGVINVAILTPSGDTVILDDQLPRATLPNILLT